MEGAAIYTIQEHEDPIEYFGIDPEEYVDIDKLVENWMEDQHGYPPVFTRTAVVPIPPYSRVR